MIDRHRLFGLTRVDYLSDTACRVELAEDLVRKRQLLDLVFVRDPGDAQLCEPCAGFGALRAHNLLTFKPGEEPLNAWAL